MNQTLLLRVQSIRSQNPFGRGGCIFTATEITECGDVIDATAYVIVKATGAQLGTTRVQPGQWWTVTGSVETYPRTTSGYVINERQITPADIALARLSGEHIVTFMSECPDFEGIGMVKARKLWETFGEGLYEILDAADVSALSKVLTPESAKCAVNAWAAHGNTRTLQWLQSSGIDVRTGRKLLAFFGHEAYEKLAEDPYRLLSFSANWRHVDSFAQSRFDVQSDDPRRLQAAVEEALYRLFDAGDTVSAIPTLLRRVESVLGSSTARPVVMAALEAGLTNGSYVIGNQGNIHLTGAMVMERTVARSITARLLAPVSILNRQTVERIIYQHEHEEGFELNTEQQQAVHCAAEQSVALILGGAGVGKTTVLKALYRVFDAAEVAIYQMALSGRAAKRMSEATGLPSWTLARFFHGAETVSMEGPTVVVVDEASMVDIITMHRLCELLPGHVRLILVGDTSQLMPVGPGLVLHALAKIPELPTLELTQVKRYGGVIAEAAADVRAGKWPSLPRDTSAPISFLPCRVAAIPETVVGLYSADPENTQIVSARRNNADGTKSLNEICQARFTKEMPALLIHNEEFDCDMWTGFHLGDPILCTKNLWNWGLQNGSLGKLVEIEEAPRLLSGPEGKELGHAIGWIEWDDGERRPVLAEMLEVLELGYALTVHKSQGSQWKRVVVVLTGSRMLDRTLVYTAITRAQTQVLIVGDEVAARNAVESLPRSELRTVGLHQFMIEELAANAPSTALEA
jgi:exodeoxyribonuclease V alpha subunit